VLGTLVNVLAILAGGGIGLLAGRGLGLGVQETAVQGIGLAVLLIGLGMSLQAHTGILAVILALALGGSLGRLADIDGRLNRGGDRLRRALGRVAGEGFTQGFVTATLLYCVGAMAIMGALEGGLRGHHDILYAKAMLDGLTAVVFAASLGIGVLFSALAVLVYQGSIALLARQLAPLLAGSAQEAMTGVGGLLIVAIALNMVGATRLKVADLLPAIPLAPLLASWLSRFGL